MFFNYNIYEIISNKHVSLKNARLDCVETGNLFIPQYLQEVCDADVESNVDIECQIVKLHLGFTDKLKEKISELSKKEYVFDEEAFCLEIGESTLLYAETERGLIHGISTIKQLQSEGGLRESFIYDYPYIKMRGMHFFTPGREALDSFKQMIETVLVRYRYNCLILEVGGAMEYKRHPKINVEWEKYSQRLRCVSGAADKLQHFTYPWSKNAIHPENGGGSYITQEEMKDLVLFCKERGIQAIPEIPLLSHTDYIVRAYPEINEREYDPDPDTYCPSNPRTYEIVFDVIDEVLDVFCDSEYVAIGHDEVVTIGVCDKCKDKNPVDLFLNDIGKINEYLKKNNRKTVMYGDKFTQLRLNGKPFIDGKGKSCGGLQGYEKGHPRYVPALYTAIERLPRDITIADWYWSFDFDETFKDFNVFLANLSGRRFKNWKERTTGKINVKAISGSNWGRSDYLHLQRNCIMFDMIFNAHMGWNLDYDDTMQEEVFRNTLVETNKYYKENILKVDKEKRYIEITHSTDHFRPYRFFYDGDLVIEENFHIGDYVITYADESTHKEPVYYGENISNINLTMKDQSFELIEATGMTAAQECADGMYYTWFFENPHPDKEIVNTSFEARNGFENQVMVKSIKYL